MKKIIIVLLIGFGIYGYIQNNPDIATLFTEEDINSTQKISDAYKNQLSDIQVRGSGIVSRILSEDNKGSRHQRFILRLVRQASW